jgi:hypothetical protein
MLLETLVYSPLNRLTWLLAREYFIQSVTRRHIASVYECTFYALSCTFTTDVSYVLHTYY